MAPGRKAKAQKNGTTTTPTRPATPPARTAQPSSERIAARAYELWLASGRPHGQHEAHWFAAERELRAQPAR